MSFATGMKTIVVASDLKSKSEAALEYARKLATGYGARIVLAHGLDPVDYAAVDALPGQVRRGMTEEARAALEKLSGELMREGIHSHSEIRQGAVAEMLVAVAKQYDAGLIVIGTRGMKGAGGVIVGAIAEQLVRLSPCPVLAVAADWNAGEFRPVPGGPVLLAMERNEAAAAAIGTAYSLAKTFDRTLIVLHARSAAEASAFLNTKPMTLEEFGIEPGGHTTVRCVVKDGNPSDVIVEANRQYHPSILVAGVKRSSDTAGPHGTAFSLLSRSRVPVLCVPPEVAAKRVGGIEARAGAD
jgi:nucleotide-binding universal stress UspA family protein